MKLFLNLLPVIFVIIIATSKNDATKTSNIDIKETNALNSDTNVINRRDNHLFIKRSNDNKYNSSNSYNTKLVRTDRGRLSKRKLTPKFGRVRKSSLNQNFFNTIGVRNNCTHQVCFPPIGNLLIGRRNFLYANSTCGLYNAERFCILGDSYMPTVKDSLFLFVENEIEKRSRCLVCDSREPYSQNRNSHRIENVISARKQTNEELATKWWQSENGVENVFIQFDLESEFILAHIYMVFKSFPPAAMLFEKSSDYGMSWQPIAFFASNCDESFPDIPKRSEYLSTPICVSRYSQRDGTANRELIYRPLYRYRYLDPYLLTKHLKITNLRFNLTKQHMLGDHYMADRDEDVFSKYYYAIKEIQIIGTCFCNGHSSQCVQDKNVHYDEENENRMIHSKCVCQHYTTGNNCQKCLPLYNNRPWRAAEYGQANECELCECNGHAHSCTFDEKLYAANGDRDGGVCACLHNTEGLHCERCKKNYYHDKSLPFDHPDACKPCKCNPVGTQNSERICTDENCMCKVYVTGPRCDTCLDGYWNLSEHNAEYGCKKCDCMLEGTTNNLGCDKRTGTCYPCKSNVIGARCDKCKPGHWGLSALVDTGCQSCSCAPGFSYSTSECDQSSGQCSCKANFHGPKCDLIGEGFYCARIDHLVYEAEEALEVNNYSQISEKYDLTDNSDVDDGENDEDEDLEYDKRTTLRWTGIGFMRVFEGSRLKFMISHSLSTGIFDLVMRYDAQENWENVYVKVTNLGAHNGFNSHHTDKKPSSRSCSNLSPLQNRMEESETRLYRYGTSSVVYSNYCFEQHHNYEVEISFNHGSVTSRKQRSVYNSAREMSSILIDSLVVVPNIDSLLNTTSDEILLEKYREAKDCLYDYMSLPQRTSNRCDLAFCIVTNEFFGLLPCECDPMGSFSNTCAQLGGDCLCKPNVAGQKCNKCRQTTWGFSSKGCQPCNCDYGSKSNLCDVKSGQCDCYDNHAGKHCGECAPGYYNPPHCHKCQCNGLSDTCTREGICNACRAHTAGSHCERCAEGFYGAPLHGIPCKSCACPGVNGNNFALECLLNDDSTSASAFRCVCRKGYAGERCERCDSMYFGNPLQPNGQCRKCLCNDNVDRNDPNACDSKTGQCNNCLYNTYGFNCEKCQVGYYGNALDHDCKKCNCNAHGTDPNSPEQCDHQFGHCKCLPNVIGKLCDECAENYWNLESGKGCMQCDCDISGTVAGSTSCDQHTGQCNCIAGRGGRTCRDCPFGYWGSPRTGCRKCKCTIHGSQTAQCDKYSGHCVCMSGITGYNCDKCARGTYGRAPVCTKCGECFDNWDDTISHLNDRLERLEKRAINIYANIGAANAATNLSDFYSQYEQMRHKVSDIAHIIGFNRTNERLNGLPRLNGRLDSIRLHVQELVNSFERSTNKISKWTLNASETQIKAYRETFTVLYNQTMHLLKVSISLSESFVNGAQISIRISYNVSNEANEIMENSFDEATEKRMRAVLSELYDRLNKTVEKLGIDEQTLIELSASRKRDAHREFEQHIALLDSAICGGEALIKPDCSSKCGSFKCPNKCGYFNASSSLEDGVDEECSSGLESSYLKLVHRIDEFKTIYQKRESLLKSDLNKFNTEKISRKKTDEDIHALKQRANSTFYQVSMQSDLINNLISKAFNYSDKYINLRNQIETSCNKMTESFNSTRLEEQNKELEEKIELIQSKSQELRSESLKEDEEKVKNSSSLDIKLNLTDFDHWNDIKNLSNSTANTSLIVESNEQILSNFTEVNENVLNHQSNITDSLEKTREHLKTLVGGEEEEMSSNGQTDFAQKKNNYGILEYKVNEIKARIGNANSKLQSISTELENLMASIGTNDENDLIQLVELKEKILLSEKKLKEKRNKLEEYHERNVNLSKTLGNLREELLNLKTTTVSLYSQLAQKSKFIRTCQ